MNNIRMNLFTLQGLGCVLGQRMIEPNDFELVIGSYGKRIDSVLLSNSVFDFFVLIFKSVLK